MDRQNDTWIVRRVGNRHTKVLYFRNGYNCKQTHFIIIFPGTKIYVFGGSHLETGQDVRIVECFDTERRKWEDDFRFRKGMYYKTIERGFKRFLVFPSSVFRRSNKVLLTAFFYSCIPVLMLLSTPIFQC